MEAIAFQSGPGNKVERPELDGMLLQTERLRFLCQINCLENQRRLPRKLLRRWLSGGGITVVACFACQYNIPVVHPLIQEIDRALSPYIVPWLQKTFGHVNAPLGLLFNLAVLTSVLFVLSMTLIPILERLFIRDLIRRGEREERKIEAIREKVQFRPEKKNHAR